MKIRKCTFLSPIRDRCHSSISSSHRDAKDLIAMKLDTETKSERLRVAKVKDSV